MGTHNWAWWATKCVLDQKQPIDVFFMGSSLMQRVMDEGEATYLNEHINGLLHRNSTAMEGLLKPKFQRHVATNSYTVGGLHASDAAMVTAALLRDEHKPAAIVYGIAPRDMMNNLLSGPTDTETFQLLNRLRPQPEVAKLAYTSSSEKFDHAVSNALIALSPLYDWRAELSQVFRRRVGRKLNDIANLYVPVPKNPLKLLDQIRLRMSPEELTGELSIAPFDPKHPTCEDNRAGYLFAYRPFRARFYERQKVFFQQMLKTANERGIQVIVVNMPLRSDNLSAMEPGFYDLYLNDLRAMTAKYNASFMDMNDQITFSHENFTDQVHLNGAGALKLVQCLAPRLSSVLQTDSVERRDAGAFIAGVDESNKELTE